MNAEELKHLEDTIVLGMKTNKNDVVWQAAFAEYNKDAGPFFPLNLGCAQCYIKVLIHLRKKQK